MFSATDNNMHNVANIPHNIVSTTRSRHVNVNNVMDHPRSIPSSAYGKAHEVVDRLASLCQVEKDITQSWIEPPTSSLRIWVYLHHHSVVWGRLRRPQCRCGSAPSKLASFARKPIGCGSWERINPCILIGWECYAHPFALGLYEGSSQPSTIHTIFNEWGIATKNSTNGEWQIWIMLTWGL